MSVQQRLLVLFLLFVIRVHATTTTTTTRIKETCTTENGYDVPGGSNPICWTGTTTTITANTTNDNVFSIEENENNNPTTTTTTTNDDDDDDDDDDTLVTIVEMQPSCPTGFDLQVNLDRTTSQSSSVQKDSSANLLMTNTVHMFHILGSIQLNNNATTSSSEVVLQMILCPIEQVGLCTPYNNNNVSNNTGRIESEMIRIQILDNDHEQQQQQQQQELDIQIPIFVERTGNYFALATLLLLSPDDDDLLFKPFHQMANMPTEEQNRILSFVSEPNLMVVSTSVRYGAWFYSGFCCFVLLFLFYHVSKHSKNQVLQLTQGTFLKGMICMGFIATLFTFSFEATNKVNCHFIGPFIILPLHIMYAILAGRLWRINAVISPLLLLSLKNDYSSSDRGIGRKSSSANQNFSLHQFLIHGIEKFVTWSFRWEDIFCCCIRRNEFSSSNNNNNTHKSSSLSNNNKTVKRQVTQGHLTKVILLFTFPQVVIQILLAILQPNQLTFIISGDEAYYQCGQDGLFKSSVLEGFSLGFLLCMILLVLILAYSSRDLPSLFNETRILFDVTLISILLMAIALLFILMESTSSANSNPNVWFMISVVSVGTLTVLTCLKIVWPILQRVWSGEVIFVSKLLADHAIKTRRHTTRQIRKRSSTGGGGLLMSMKGGSSNSASRRHRLLLGGGAGSGSANNSPQQPFTSSITTYNAEFTTSNRRTTIPNAIRNDEKFYQESTTSEFTSTNVGSSAELPTSTSAILNDSWGNRLYQNDDSISSMKVDASSSYAELNLTSSNTPPPMMSMIPQQQQQHIIPVPEDEEDEPSPPPPPPTTSSPRMALERLPTIFSHKRLSVHKAQKASSTSSPTNNIDQTPQQQQVSKDDDHSVDHYQQYYTDDEEHHHRQQHRKNRFEISEERPPPRGLLLRMIDLQQLLSSMNHRILCGTPIDRHDWNILRKHAIGFGTLFSDKITFSWERQSIWDRDLQIDAMLEGEDDNIAMPQGFGSNASGGDDQESRSSVGAGASGSNRSSIQRYQHIAAALRKNLIVKDRKYRLTTYKQCFIASEAVDFLVASKFVSSRAEAVQVGKKLQHLPSIQLFQHVCNDHDFADDFLFFRFTGIHNFGNRALTNAIRDMDDLSSAAASASAKSGDGGGGGGGGDYVVVGGSQSRSSAGGGDVNSSTVQQLSLATDWWERRNNTHDDTTSSQRNQELSKNLARVAVALKTNVEVKDRRYRMLVYSQCFVASEAVDYMVHSKIAKNRKQAVQIATKVNDVFGIFVHVANDHEFKDDYLFFRFVDRTTMDDEQQQQQQQQQDGDDGDDGDMIGHSIHSVDYAGNSPSIVSELGDSVTAGGGGSTSSGRGFFPFTTTTTTSPWKQMTIEGLKSIALSFRNDVEIQDRTYHTKTYESCFIGSEAVDYFVGSGYAISRKDAVQLGRYLARKFALFSHVTKDHLLKDAYFFYRFNDSGGENSISIVRSSDDVESQMNHNSKSSISTSQNGGESGANNSNNNNQDVSSSANSNNSASSTSKAALSQNSSDRWARLSDYDLARIAIALKRGVPVRDRRYHLVQYRRCFVGRQTVDFLINSGYARSRKDATRLASSLMEKFELFEHVTQDHGFEDGYKFYRFLPGNHFFEECLEQVPQTLSGQNSSHGGGGGSASQKSGNSGSGVGDDDDNNNSLESSIQSFYHAADMVIKEGDEDGSGGNNSSGEEPGGGGAAAVEGYAIEVIPASIEGRDVFIVDNKNPGYDDDSNRNKTSVSTATTPPSSLTSTTRDVTPPTSLLTLSTKKTEEATTPTSSFTPTAKSEKMVEIEVSSSSSSSPEGMERAESTVVHGDTNVDAVVVAAALGRPAQSASRSIEDTSTQPRSRTIGDRSARSQARTIDDRSNRLQSRTVDDRSNRSQSRITAQEDMGLPSVPTPLRRTSAATNNDSNNSMTSSEAPGDERLEKLEARDRLEKLEAGFTLVRQKSDKERSKRDRKGRDVPKERKKSPSLTPTTQTSQHGDNVVGPLPNRPQGDQREPQMRSPSSSQIAVSSQPDPGVVLQQGRGVKEHRKRERKGRDAPKQPRESSSLTPTTQTSRHDDNVVEPLPNRPQREPLMKSPSSSQIMVSSQPEVGVVPQHDGRGDKEHRNRERKGRDVPKQQKKSSSLAPTTQTSRHDDDVAEPPPLNRPQVQQLMKSPSSSQIMLSSQPDAGLVPQHGQMLPPSNRNADKKPKLSEHEKHRLAMKSQRDRSQGRLPRPEHVLLPISSYGAEYESSGSEYTV